MKTNNPRIEITRDFDPYRRETPNYKFSEKQLKAVDDVARLSPGYSFEVVLYESGASHVKVWSDDFKSGEVGLVGRGCVQYYDNRKETEKVVQRVSHRVYHQSLHFEPATLKATGE